MNKYIGYTNGETLEEKINKTMREMKSETTPNDPVRPDSKSFMQFACEGADIIVKSGANSLKKVIKKNEGI